MLYMRLCILLIVAFSCVIQGDPITNVHKPYYIHGDYATEVRNFCSENACRYYDPVDGCVFHCVLDFEWAMATCELHAENEDDEKVCNDLDEIWFNKAAAANCNDDELIWDCVIDIQQQDCDYDFSTCENQPYAAAREEQSEAFAAQEEKSEANMPSATVQVKSKDGKYRIFDHINTGDMVIYGSIFRVHRIGADSRHMRRYRQRYLSTGGNPQQDELDSIVA